MTVRTPGGEQQCGLAGERGRGEEEAGSVPVTHGPKEGRNGAALFLGFADSHSSPSSLLPGNSVLSWQHDVNA